MSYPFSGKSFHKLTSYKLKLISVIRKKPITKIVQEIVDSAILALDEGELDKAKKEIGRFSR